MKNMIVRRYPIHLKNLPQAFWGYKLLFLTDLHGCVTPLLPERIAAERPDAILIGGDMMVGFLEKEKFGKTRLPEAEAFIAGLAGKYRVFYAYGNHEGKTLPEAIAAYRSRLEARGVCFLEDASAALVRDGQKLMLHGLCLEQVWYPKGRRVQYPLSEMVRKLSCYPRERPDGLCHILLAHHPNYFSTYEAWGADLVLSGHFHGGVMRLPGIGGVIGPDYLPFPPYSGGLYQGKQGAKMIVSCGLGVHTPRVRIFNPPELTCVELAVERRREAYGNSGKAGSV